MKTEKLITLIIAVVIVGAVLYIAGKQIAHGYQENLTSVGGGSKDMVASYTAVVSQENDANKLTEQGVKLIKGNQTQSGMINLKRAVEIEPNLRDAWVYLGYAQIKNGNYQEAIGSLKRAEEIDPINPYTYELQAAAYRGMDDQGSADKAIEKQKNLTK